MSVYSIDVYYAIQGHTMKPLAFNLNEPCHVHNISLHNSSFIESDKTLPVGIIRSLFIKNMPFLGIVDINFKNQN